MPYKGDEKQLDIEYIPAKHIVIPTKSSQWFGIDYNMNIYRGCCHGCIYCDSRSDCYQIEEFDRVRAKADALRIIRDDLRRKVRSGVVGTGAMSDPYNPCEASLCLTRHSLELLDAFQFGVAIATKSDLITRDIDILQDIAVHSPVLCKLTVTTASDSLSQKLEPGAPSSSRRLAALSSLSEKGIFSGILLMPVLPFLEDSAENILEIVRLAGECGARFIYPAFGMTMRPGQREWFLSKLDTLFPGQALSERYRKRYGSRYQWTSPQAKKLWNLFTQACDRLGILYRMPEIIHAYQMGYAPQQLTLFP